MTEHNYLYSFQVNTYGDPADSWAGNAIKFDSIDKAKDAAENLFQRWTSVKFWRVIDHTGKVVFEQDLLRDSKGYI